MGQMILLNGTGDVTIQWSEEHNDHMRELIRKKLADGYSFFIIKSFLGIKHKVKLHSVDDIKIGIKLLLQDDDAIRLFEEGKITAGRTVDRNLDVSHRSEDVEEIARSASLATKPIRGG